MHTGQVGVGRYSLQFGPARDVIVDYLSERQPVMDYTSLEDLSRMLALHFWKNLELHSPGIESFHLTPEVAAAWKQRIQTKTAQRKESDGAVIDVASPRRTVVQLISLVRAFYSTLPSRRPKTQAAGCLGRTLPDQPRGMHPQEAH
ncbi:hypothetical protein [Streptomyces sp. NRRL S-244]|uniref:hypothetical protein n=1 Tax=Streptomyces sp. NRRL S-244 TaxID=1463897 RepID=UPI000690A6EE|nr:hypothetical protein [Streptomyces sp. NRRL S-244]